MQKHHDQPESTDQLGLVVSYFGNSVAVETDDGQVFQCHLRRNQELPLVGDYVYWQRDQEGETGVITGIKPRKSLLARGDGRGKMKPIAANLDTVVIVMAPPPIFSEHLIDRYLIAAELLGIDAILVMNKADLLNETSEKDADAHLAPYASVPYPTIKSSIYLDNGMEDLRTILANKTAVLVGPSGVGKSSIISALGASDTIRIGEVSPKGAGRHTTTATRLYHLPSGGRLIDSPGVREFNLWPVTKADVLRGFKEFHDVEGECKFRDCQHTAEPGCAVQAAVANGKINPQRYASYQEFMKQAEPNNKKY